MRLPSNAGTRFLTLVYQIDKGSRRLLWVAEKRRVKPLLGFFRWLLLKRPENLSEKQEPKLAELLKYNLRLVRVY